MPPCCEGADGTRNIRVKTQKSKKGLWQASTSLVSGYIPGLCILCMHPLMLLAQGTASVQIKLPRPCPDQQATTKALLEYWTLAICLMCGPYHSSRFRSVNEREDGNNGINLEHSGSYQNVHTRRAKVGGCVFVKFEYE